MLEYIITIYLIIFVIYSFDKATIIYQKPYIVDRTKEITMAIVESFVWPLDLYYRLTSKRY